MGEVTEWQSRLLALGIQLRNCTGRSTRGRQNDSHVTCNGMDEEEREADSMEFPMRFHQFFQEFHWAAKCCHVKMDETETLKFRNSPAAGF